MNWADSGRFLIIAGTVIIIIGLFFMLSDKIPFGRLPGDLKIGSGRFKVYFPLMTSVMFTVILTIIVNFFARR